MKRPAAFLLLALFCTVPSQADWNFGYPGQQLYLATDPSILWVGGTGTSSGPGTYASPYDTIQHAINALNPPVTNKVVVQDGTYTCASSGATNVGDCAHIAYVGGVAGASLLQGVTLAAQHPCNTATSPPTCSVHLNPPQTSTSGYAISVYADNVTVTGLDINGCPNGRCANGGQSLAANSFWGICNVSSTTVSGCVTNTGASGNLGSSGCATGDYIGDSFEQIPNNTTISTSPGSASFTISSAAGTAHSPDIVFCWGPSTSHQEAGSWRTGIISQAQFTVASQNWIRNLIIANPVYNANAATNGGSGIDIIGQSNFTANVLFNSGSYQHLVTGNSASNGTTITGIADMTGITLWGEVNSGNSATCTGITAGTLYISQIEGTCGTNCVTISGGTLPATACTTKTYNFINAPACSNVSPCGRASENVVQNMALPSMNTTVANGIYIASGGITAQNNIVSNVWAGTGIVENHGGPHASILNNTVFQSYTGIEVSTGSGGGGYSILPIDYEMIANNIVYNCGPYGVTGVIANGFGIADGTGPGPHNVISNNISTCANRYTGASIAYTSPGASVPSFINYQANGSGNYALLQSSWGVAQGAATIGGVNAPMLAIDGTVRPQGTTNDLGAYQTSLSGTPATGWNVGQANQYFDIFDATNGTGRVATLHQIPSANTYTLVSSKCDTTASPPSGGYYAEFTITSPSSSGGSFVAVGLAQATDTNPTTGVIATGNYLGFNLNSLGLFASGSLYNAGSNTTGHTPTWTPGSSSHRVDMDVQFGSCNRAFFRVDNGSWGDSGNPGACTGGIAITSSVYASAVCPAVVLENNNDTVTANFASSSWIGTSIPSGAAQW